MTNKAAVAAWSIRLDFIVYAKGGSRLADSLKGFRYQTHAIAHDMRRSMQINGAVSSSHSWGGMAAKRLRKVYTLVDYGKIRSF